MLACHQKYKSEKLIPTLVIHHPNPFLPLHLYKNSSTPSAKIPPRTHNTVNHFSSATMRTVLSLTLVGLLAAIGYAAPLCVESNARLQEVFTPVSSHVHHWKPESDDGIVYLPPGRSRKVMDLDAIMQEAIDREMKIDYHHAEYLESLTAELCSRNNLLFCQVEILDTPTIQVIPAEPISRYFVCSTSTCTLTITRSLIVSTTHSGGDGLVGASSKPFAVGVSFTVSAGYGFSSTSEAPITLTYSTELVPGDSGYVGMVAAQISAKVRISAYNCPNSNMEESAKCWNDYSQNGPNFYQTGHHEAVVLRNGTPRNCVAFVHA
ncbi:MAG: hypothetical protein J3R72DRAFT_436609 [Linnemannia gamsii]|nr:MAG: hypothetical protein J3R72DRAFT_436609 [Linnemannia gamsii]